MFMKFILLQKALVMFFNLDMYLLKNNLSLELFLRCYYTGTKDIYYE